MKNRYFDIVVKKILKHKGKLIDIGKLKVLFSSLLAEEYSQQKMYKMIYYLKNRGYLYPLKKDIYFVKLPDAVYNDDQLLEMFYRNIVKQHCKKYLDSDWYIGGVKALELNLSHFDFSDELLVVNRYKQSSEIIAFDKKIIYKKYYSENKTLFKLFYKNTHKIYIKNNVFPVANIELSLLESLYNTPLLSQPYIYELVKKVLRKHKNSLDFKIWSQILMNNKHHSSINRLYKLAQSIDPQLAENIKNIIKRFGYFVNV